MPKKKRAPAQKLARQLQAETDRPYTQCLADVEKHLARTGRLPFIPPAHYRRDDGVDCCVHTIPVGPDSCPECRDLNNPTGA